MVIHIKYPDNRFDFVKDITLDLMIESKTISEFKRSTGWVKVGVDPMRKTKRNRVA